MNATSKIDTCPACGCHYLLSEGHFFCTRGGLDRLPVSEPTPTIDTDFYSFEALQSLDAADIIMEDIQRGELPRELSLRLVALDALISQAEDCLEELRASNGLDPIG